jgi:hypothetical protein
VNVSFRFHTITLAPICQAVPLVGRGVPAGLERLGEAGTFGPLLCHTLRRRCNGIGDASKAALDGHTEGENLLAGVIAERSISLAWMRSYSILGLKRDRLSSTPRQS